ncbi:MAG: beta-propeller fold lactonase family protein [Candidatus Angelobacter sp.]
MNGEVHKEFMVTPSGISQVGKDITLPTPDRLDSALMASADGFLFALDSGTAPLIDSFRSDPIAGTVSSADTTSVGSGVARLSVDPSGAFLYANAAHDLPPGGYISEMDAFHILADGSLSRVPGAPFAMYGGTGGGCCAFLTSDLVFTPDGTRAYGVLEVDCPCHSAPSSIWMVQSFQRNPVSGTISMDPIQQSSPPPSLSFMQSLAIVKNGKFVVFPTVDGLMVYSINSSDGSFTKAPVPSPVPAVDNDHLYQLLAATKDGEFVYLNQTVTGLVYGFHVETNGALTPVPGSPYSVPFENLLLMSSSNNFVLVVSGQSQTLVAFKRNPTTGELTPFVSVPVNGPIHAMMNLN